MTGTGWLLRPPRAPAWWQALVSRSMRRGDVALIVLDAALVVVAYLMLLVVRHGTNVPSEAWGGLRIFLPVAIGVHLAANLLAGLYGPVWEQASIREAQRLLGAGIASMVVVTTAVALWRQVPLSVALVGGGMAMGLFGLLRFHSRLFAVNRQGRSDGPRVLVVGAGESATALLRELDRSEDAAFKVVGLLDDDPRKRGRRLGGVPILGTIDDVVPVARTTGVDQILLAIPSATSALVRRVADAAAEVGAALKVLPRVAEFMNGHPRLRDIRDLSIDDLLGRQQIATDLASVRGFLHGRRVLVTGAGGSVGAEIARQVAAYGPAELLVLDHDETHLFDLAAELDGHCIEVLADIREGDRLRELFAQRRPEIVFHAAAHKHVPLLEAYPGEAAATNVLGTSNVVRAARECGVERFVFISTDKAVNPSSVMGASKRIGEQLVLSAAPPGAAWCAVRFGNVLGSRGSVVPTFVRQIRRGGPVTVTHPDVTRYFMSIAEAVQLVLQASALADDHGVFMLEMGEPVRIIDLANRMITLAGYRAGVDIQIEVTGLRPGEKLCEELSRPDEHPRATQHPNIVQLHPRLLHDGVLADALAALARGLEERDDQGVRRVLLEVARHEPDVIRIPDVEPGTDAAQPERERT